MPKSNPRPALAGLHPTHPGEILRDDVLPALGLAKTKIAELLGVSRQTLYDLLEGRQAMTATMALRVAKLLGNDPVFWMNLQANYDLAVARAAIGPEVDRIQTLDTATAAP